jgi:CRISPR-associated protein Cmr2
MWSDELLGFSKELMKEWWDEIWENSQNPDTSTEEFDKKIINELPMKIYKKFIIDNEITYDYIKFLTFLNIFFSENEKIYTRYLSTLKKFYWKKTRKGKKKEEICPEFNKESIKSSYKKFIHEKKSYDGYIEKQMHLINSLEICPRNDKDFTLFMNNNSFYFLINFSLKKPYISKDDEEFYIHENPISKEKVFKIPYIRPSSWKGMIRWAALMKMLKNTKEEKNWDNALSERSHIIRIFGNEKENREDKIFEELFPGKIPDSNENKFNHDFLEYIIKKNYVNKDGLGKGRLYFYPTFFNRISLDIINPHDRETRTGTNPITMEIVPEGTEGYLKLFYFPFDLTGEDKKIVKKEMKEDLSIICNAIKILFEDYGISAKRTSGYGAVEIRKIKFKSNILSELDQIENINTLINELRRQGVGFP